MQIRDTKLNFKGYDSTILKRVYIDNDHKAPINRELKEISEKENFSLCYGYDKNLWMQDLRCFIRKNNNTQILANIHCLGYLGSISKKLHIKTEYNSNFTTGGNTFIGKYPNGEKWLLIGENEIKNDERRSTNQIGEAYEIKPNNIFVIPQQYYHLDMFIRPIGYPYVLINNPESALSHLKKLKCRHFLSPNYRFSTACKTFEKERKQNYASFEEVKSALEKAGFMPIEIVGAYGNSVNFMNAIVNQHEDGTISYITNSSKCKNKFISNLEKEFEKELRKKVPNVKDVYFIKGDRGLDDKNSNYMMFELSNYGGGIHCMSLEEPNFEVIG